MKTLASVLVYTVAMSAQSDPEPWLHGTWLAISHQTITVIDYRPDGSFASTYFTPAVDLKTCLEGTWELHDGVLRTRYLRSVPPALNVPLEDADRIERRGRDQFRAYGTNDQIVLTYDRVAFKNRSEVFPGTRDVNSAPKVAITPTLDELRRIGTGDATDRNVLWEYIISTINTAPGDTYAEKMRHAIEKELSEAAANYYLTMNNWGQWSNGGMKDVLLCDLDEVADKRWELERTVQAFRYYGFIERADLLASLIPKAMEWSAAIAKLNAREEAGETVDEALFGAIWKEVDKCDGPYGGGFADEGDGYDTMFKHIRAYPEKYLRE